MDLISVDYVLGRLGLPADEQLGETIASAISAATPYLETVTACQFDAAPWSEVFLINPAIEVCVGGTYVLRTATGFISTEVDVEMFQSSSIRSVQLTSPDPDPADYVHVDHEKGFIFVEESLENVFLRVDYSAGFQTLDEVPMWLREAALYQVVCALSAQQIGDGKPGLAEVYDYLKEQNEVLLNAKRRNRRHSIEALL